MKRCAPFGWASLIVAVVGLLIAAAAPTGRVVILLKDGTNLSGELVEVTPAAVTVRATPKSPPISQPWSAIKQVGGGISREAIVQEWRRTQPEKLCGACQGDGVTECTVCGGKGIDPATAKPCEKCDGKGTIGKCRTPRCVDGQIPCPNTCLKPTDFTGAKDADGKRWKNFRAKNGDQKKWSDDHIGELITFEDGTPQNKGKCPRCDGKSVIADPACKGKGQQPCGICKGAGVLGPDCSACDAGKTPCKTCDGTGLKAATTAPAT